ncbi:glycosyltransferase family 2 protein [Jannaschia sp. M317]|uniref:glycosyltransferase family 2 protein n=1 Tax=Jannaschia sp. M317 TaxID=2867011 RepID=UPI0021A8EFFA|nr:glycosyltransferase [Jannaschia sp. M317]
MSQNLAPPVFIAIASAGRGGIVHDTLRHTASLTDRPDGIILCLPDDQPADADAPDLPDGVRVLTSPRGLCAQRNTVIEAAPKEAIVLYLDDDFLLGDGSVSALRQLFANQPEVVMATGRVVADGIGGPGFDHARGQVELAGAPARTDGRAVPTYNAYGCNMAVRVAPAIDHGLRFDTRLPMYGWLEDVDFSRQMARFGEILKLDTLYGVHLGTKKGRSRGVPLGYSQIANPVYLIRKGTMAPRRALRLMARNMAANTAKILRPEAWIDRPGRLRGNLMALGDLVRGRLDPTRVRDL